MSIKVLVEHQIDKLVFYIESSVLVWKGTVNVGTPHQPH